MKIVLYPKRSDNPLYLGIDPGGHGGVGWICGHGYGAIPLPKIEVEILKVLRRLCSHPGIVQIALEKVWGYIGKQETARGSHMFNFGWNYGCLQMALAACNQSNYLNPVPKEWQASLDVIKRGTLKKPAFKKYLKEKAQLLFPKIKVTLATADALLLAEYCRRTILFSKSA